jgi:hypothetical protein
MVTPCRRGADTLALAAKGFAAAANRAPAAKCCPAGGPLVPRRNHINEAGLSAGGFNRRGRACNRHPLRRLCPAKQRNPSDIKYCDALSKVYSSLFPVMERMPASDAVTMNRCNTDTRASIATLEEKLRDKKIEPPPHESVAQQTGSTGNTR